MKRTILALLIAATFGVFALTGVVLMTADDGDSSATDSFVSVRSKADASPTAETAIEEAAPTPNLPPGYTPGFRPPVPEQPTPIPGREGPETTLVELATGRSVRLWQSGVKRLTPQFSNDSHWLVFDRATDPPSSEIYRLDLRDKDLKPEKVADGFAPRISADNDIAFTTGDASSQATGRHRVQVLTASGVLKTFEPRGAPWSLSWSQDGRWLAYQDLGDLALGEDRKLEHFLVDVRTWNVKSVGLSFPTGHGGPVLWSLMDARFLYMAVDAAEPGRNKLLVFDALSETSIGAPRNASWAADGRLAGFIEREAGGNRLYDAFVQDMGSPEPSIMLPDLEGPLTGTGWSPDGSMAAYSTDAAGGGRTHIVDVQGAIIARDFGGSFVAWSADGSYVLTWSNASQACRNGISVYKVDDGQPLHCFTTGSFAPVVAAFSPSTSLVAYVKPTPLDDDPRIARPPLKNEVYLVDLATGRERKLLSDILGYINCLLWSPDAKWLVVDDFCDRS